SSISAQPDASTRPAPAKRKPRDANPAGEVALPRHADQRAQTQRASSNAGIEPTAKPAMTSAPLCGLLASADSSNAPCHAAHGPPHISAQCGVAATPIASPPRTNDAYIR